MLLVSGSGSSSGFGRLTAAAEHATISKHTHSGCTQQMTIAGCCVRLLELSSATKQDWSSEMLGGAIRRSGWRVGGGGVDAQVQLHLHKQTHKTRHTQHYNTKQKHNHIHKNNCDCHSKNQPLWLPTRGRAPRRGKTPPRRPPQRLTSRMPPTLTLTLTLNPNPNPTSK